MAPSALLYEVDGHIDGDGMYPSVKARLSTEAANGAIRFREDFLEEVIGVLVVRGHVIDESVEPRAVTHDELIERLGLTSLCTGDQFVIVGFRNCIHSGKNPIDIRRG